MTLTIGLYNYWMVIILMMIGLYTMISRGHLVKKLVGLNIFQAAVFLLYISVGFVRDAAPPLLDPDVERYSNPLPHVLILTAIVVGVATTALGLALALRIREAYGTVDEDELHRLDNEF